jgi:8-oxo-dGTP diphosphatase
VIKAFFKRLVWRLHLYWLAAALYETYRLLIRPHTHGALVAIWHQHEVLLVQTSYRSGLSLPGGGIQQGESARQAAARELSEELGLVVPSEQFLDPWTITEHGRGGLNTVMVFSLDVDAKPKLAIDGLEIVDCQWFSCVEALSQQIPGHVRDYLHDRAIDFR